MCALQGTLCVCLGPDGPRPGRPHGQHLPAGLQGHAPGQSTGLTGSPCWLMYPTGQSTPRQVTQVLLIGQYTAAGESTDGQNTKYKSVYFHRSKTFNEMSHRISELGILPTIITLNLRDNNYS